MVISVQNEMASMNKNVSQRSSLRYIFYIHCSIYYTHVSDLTIFPHIDEIVIGKGILGISACKNVDIFLLFLFTGFVKDFCEEFF